MDRDESAKKLAAKDLHNNNNGPNDTKSWVCGDSLQDVLFIIDLSRADHVEDLHEHKQIENHSQVTRWCR